MGDILFTGYVIHCDTGQGPWLTELAIFYVPVRRPPTVLTSWTSSRLCILTESLGLQRCASLASHTLFCILPLLCEKGVACEILSTQRRAQAGCARLLSLIGSVIHNTLSCAICVLHEWGAGEALLNEVGMQTNMQEVTSPGTPAVRPAYSPLLNTGT